MNQHMFLMIRMLKYHLQIWCLVIERSTTQPSKEGRCRKRAIYPARELAIFYDFFLLGSHAYIFLFNSSIASVGTVERIAKIRVSKSPKLKFLWNFEKGWNGPKVNVERVDFWLEMGLYQNFNQYQYLNFCVNRYWYRYWNFQKKIIVGSVRNLYFKCAQV